MRIKFGTYSLKIKSYTAHELNLDDSYKNFTFQIYQKVFHFWFIPIFPVEKHWKIKDKQTNLELAETDATMRSAIDLKMLKRRSPVWSFTGSIVLAIPLIIGLVYVVYGMIDSSADEISKGLAKNSRISAKNDLVQDPVLDDLYTFKVIEVDAVTDANGHIAKYEVSPYGSPKKADYQVNYITRDSIGFDFVKNKEYFMQSTNDLQATFRLAKNDLVNASKGYKELPILKYPNSEDSKSKKLVGIFEIQRPEQKIY